MSGARVGAYQRDSERERRIGDAKAEGEAFTVRDLPAVVDPQLESRLGSEPQDRRQVQGPEALVERRERVSLISFVQPPSTLNQDRFDQGSRR